MGEDDTGRARARDVIEAAGGNTKVADTLGLNRRAVWQWSDNDMIPPTRVLAMERLSGVSRHSIRPDIYGPEPEAA